MNSALLVTLDAIKSDTALHKNGRGARKILVTKLHNTSETPSVKSTWKPDTLPQKCPVQVMENTELAVFNQYAKQDRHFHKKGTEIYEVLEGVMHIEIEKEEFILKAGDMVVVNPNSVHEVKPEGTEFLCRVITVYCGGKKDKFCVPHE